MKKYNNEDILASEIKEVTRKATESICFSKLKYPYIDSYEKLNKAIVEKAKNGENSILFDFVDNKEDFTKSLEEIKKNHNRIYLSIDGGQAIHDVYEYPDYLISRGFNVEIRKSLRLHGYISKAYYISW